MIAHRESLLGLQDRLNQGAEIDHQDVHGNTPLIIAIDTQNDRVAEFFLKKGANPLLTNKQGNTASDFISSSSPLFDLLNQKIKERQALLLSPPLRLNNLLLEEVAKIDAQTRKVKELLIEGADINYQDADGYTALMIAIDHQNERIAEYLLNQGADPLVENNHQETAKDLASRNTGIFTILSGYELLYATFNDDLVQIRYLTASETDVNFQGLGGYTALMIAVEQGSTLLVEYLLSVGARADLTRKDGKGIFELVKDDSILALLQNATADQFEEGSECGEDSGDEKSTDRNRMFSKAS
jgi:ankyrin repeat protein